MASNQPRIGLAANGISENSRSATARCTGGRSPPADAARLGEAMLALAGDEALAARMGANARARFTALFREETMCAAYLDLYREVLHRREVGG